MRNFSAKCACSRFDPPGLLQAFGIALFPGSDLPLPGKQRATLAERTRFPSQAETAERPNLLSSRKPPAEDLSAKEKELLERIRKLKGHALATSFGPVGYDWSALAPKRRAWVRSQAWNLGDPPVLGSGGSFIAPA